MSARLPREAALLLLHALVLMGPALAASGGGAWLAQAPGLAFLALALTADVVERRAQGGRSDPPHFDAAAAASGLSLLACWWVSLVTCARAEPAPGLGAHTLLGATLMLGGALLRGSAIRALGRRFVTRADVWNGEPLVADGPYARLRHPSEVGLVALGLGGALLLGSAAGALLSLTVLAPSCVLRLRHEERALARGHGAVWSEYAGRVPAGLPGLGAPSPSWRAPKPSTTARAPRAGRGRGARRPDPRGGRALR